jgi:hypothetical protein
VELKVIIGIKTCLCIHVGAYFIFVLIAFGWNLIALKFLFKKALENKKENKKKEGKTLPLGQRLASPPPRPTPSIFPAAQLS